MWGLCQFIDTPGRFSYLSYRPSMVLPWLCKTYQKSDLERAVPEGSLILSRFSMPVSALGQIYSSHWQPSWMSPVTMTKNIREVTGEANHRLRSFTRQSGMVLSCQQLLASHPAFHNRVSEPFLPIPGFQQVGVRGAWLPLRRAFSLTSSSTHSIHVLFAK